MEIHSWFMGFDVSFLSLFSFSRPRGTVVDIFEADGVSTVSVALDDGKAKNFELGKQGIRFVSQKQKH